MTIAEDARRVARAHHLIEVATGLGIQLGTNGEDVAMITPLSLDHAVRKQIDDLLADLWREVIVAIQERRGSP